jgi:tRNA(Ile2) C34 agmatinyltransferase TiaS
MSLAFSCQKERLKDEKEIFIGEWELQYAIETTVWSGNPMKIDTIFPCDSPSLTFKKNGTVLFVLNGEEEKYKMNLKRHEASFNNELKDVWFIRDTGSVFFSEKQHFFIANFHNGIGAKNRTRVTGSIGKDWLRINSSSKIISEYNTSSARGESYNNFFKRRK